MGGSTAPYRAALHRHVVDGPVTLAVHVVVYLRETQVLEPRRGPGRDVSVGIEAVDDGGSVLLQTCSCFRREPVLGYVDGAGKVLL